MPVATLATIDDLLAIPGPAELIDGEIVTMSPASNDHGAIESAFVLLILAHVRQQRLGRVYTGDTGFVLDEHTVFCPDVAFVSRARLAGVAGSGFVTAVPELVVEVVSPSDLHSKVIAKAQRWLAAGSEQVWIADPETRTIEVLARVGQPGLLSLGDTINGPPALPGFTAPVAEFFAD
jgi:Uma2 family endonuclease